MRRLVGSGACLVLVFFFSACGDGPAESESAAGTQTASSSRPSGPSGSGACALLMQTEVDELFGTAIGVGVDEVLEGGVEICSWPADEEPSLLLQISDASPDIHAAVDLGPGFRVVDVADMAGRAAAAVEDADGPEAVVVLALTTDTKTVTLSPVGLGITEDSDKFQRVKAITNAVPSRIGDTMAP